MTSWSVQTPQFKYYWLGSQKQQIITLIAELKKNPHRLHVNWVNNTRVILHTHLSAVSSTRTLLLCGMTSSSGVKRCLFSLSLSLIVFVGQFCLPALQSPAGSWRALVARFHSSWAVLWPSPPSTCVCCTGCHTFNAYLTLCQNFVRKSGQFSEMTRPKRISLEENLW